MALGFWGKAWASLGLGSVFCAVFHTTATTTAKKYHDHGNDDDKYSSNDIFSRKTKANKYSSYLVTTTPLTTTRRRTTTTTTTTDTTTTATTTTLCRVIRTISLWNRLGGHLGQAGGARLPSNLGNLGHLAPAPLARRLGDLSETKIGRLLAILLPPCPTCPTCSPTSLPFGDQDCKIAWLSKIARLRRNLAQTIVLNSRHTVLLLLLLLVLLLLLLLRWDSGILEFGCAFKEFYGGPPRPRVVSLPLSKDEPAQS